MPYKDKTKQRAYAAQWMAIRKKEWLDKNGPCVKCGSAEKLQVDHINPKEKSTHRVWSWRVDKREKELSKCQVLCQVCHRKKTRLQFWKPIVHGTDSGYSNKGCRCGLCRQAHANYVREWRRNRATIARG